MKNIENNNVNPCISLEIPIKLITQPHKFEHWSKPRKRRIQTQKAIVLSLNPKIKPSLPCCVILTRMGRRCDYDNLLYSFKAVRDQIADWLIPGKAKGQADSSLSILWKYKQEPRGQKNDGFRIEIYESNQQVA